MDKEKLLEKFINNMKNNNFSDLTLRRLKTFSFSKEEVAELIPYLDIKFSNQIRFSVFELLGRTGFDSVSLFEQYFSNELSTSLPGKIMDFAEKTDNTDLILAVYSKYPSLSTMALMKLKKMKKFDSMTPFMFSENISLANLASEILNKLND